LGEPHTGAVFVGDSQNCTEGMPESDVVYYRLAEQVTAESSPRLGFTDVGDGRIKGRYRTSETGEKLELVTFVDTLTGEECRARETGAGLRCLPDGAEHTFYSDSECERALLDVYRGGDCASAETPVNVLSRRDFECKPSAYRFYSAGAQVMPERLFHQGAQCEAIEIDLADRVLYDTTEIPLTEFAPLEDIIE
jgi:hypothetical protein